MTKKAFSFVEILIASVVSVLLISPLMLIFQQSTRQTEQSHDEILAMIQAREITEQVRLIRDLCGFDFLHKIPSDAPAKGFADLDEIFLARGSLFVNPHPFVSARSHMFLSQKPAHFRRLIRIYPADKSISDQNYSPVDGLLHLEVQIEWKSPDSRFLKHGDFDRKIRMNSLITRDEVLRS